MPTDSPIPSPRRQRRCHSDRSRREKHRATIVTGIRLAREDYPPEAQAAFKIIDSFNAQADNHDQRQDAVEESLAGIGSEISQMRRQVKCLARAIRRVRDARAEHRSA